ncbi:DNRLRE domain-containing protein [Luteolibacter flavescens]|uniref:DNRLRE domain-containing protein n=1 Tax=Luteolibacter flavescens TaxID=1859460 RepID=A0ABT3FVC6_9BACT|nr:DNRLRE domain-containing protein [Luteolibacter flavescens]MCW1887548.1 DNRLRE domain-containing protein [Luteolibacter flavescens]
MKFLVVASFILAGQMASRGESVTLTPVKDRDVYQGTGNPTGSDFSLGVSASLALGGGHSQKSVIQFDVGSASIGMAEAEIGSATLRLYVMSPEVYPYEQNIGGDVLISYQMQTWTEASLRWSTFSRGDSIGTLKLIGDRPYNDGRGTTIYEINTWVEVDVTAAVKEWTSGRKTNHGFLLEPDEVNTPYLSAAFADSITGWKPELVITRAEPPAAFKLLSWERGVGKVTLTWSSVPGRRYAIEESVDLVAWNSIGEFTASATTTTGEATTDAGGGDRAFYRVNEILTQP